MRGSQWHGLLWRRMTGGLLIGAGLISLAAAGWLYAQQPKPLGQRQVRSTLTPAPSAAKPSQRAISSYMVAPDIPKFIGIPAINLTAARVVRLGLLRNGEIATPNNIYDTGWYDASAKPGQPGAMFIFGHVSSWQANGVFYDLKKLRPGNKIIITRGDNQTFTYQVALSKTYPYNQVNMNEVLTPIRASEPGLNLMTCAGQIIKGTSEFNERLVVFASLVAP